MSFRTHRSGGFTLVELMFSMAIGTIVLLLAATMLGTSGDGYERVGGNVAAEREARALMAQLTSDLSTAYFHKDGLIDKSSSSWSTDKIGFLTLQPAAAQTKEGRIGDLCAVNYYTKDLTMAGRTVRCLMRGFRESNDTFKALRDQTVDSLFIKQNKDEPVAFGVVSFTATPRSKDSMGKWIDWVKNDTIGPDAFDVRLVVARRSLSGRLKTPSDWNGGSGLLGPPAKADRSPNLEIYQTTVRFGNHAKS